MKSRTLPLGLLLAGACATDPTGTRIDERALQTPIAGGLSIGATVTPSTLALGDTALITVSLTNTADTAVVLRFPTGCQVHYAVEDAAGSPAPDEGGGYGCTQAVTTLVVAPGATERREFRWTHTRYTYPPQARAFLAAGSYRVVPILLPRVDAPTEHRGDAVPFEVVDTAP